MTNTTLERLPAASVAAMLLLTGIQLYHEPSVVKTLLKRRLGPLKGGALYAGLLAAAVAAWYVIQRESERHGVIRELRDPRGDAYTGVEVDL